MVPPELALHLGEVLLPQATAGHALEAVHQLGKLHGGRILDEQMHMVILTVHLPQHRAELGADAQEGVPQHHMGAIREDAASVFRDKDQVDMECANDAPSPAVFCFHLLAPANETKYTHRMVMLKAYRYRLYPTTEQEALFRQTVGSCRFVYNLCLEQRRLEWHRSNPRRLTAYDQIKELPALKDEAPWLRDVPNHPLQQAVVDLEKAFKNFFDGRASFPQFRKRGDRDSFRYPDPKQFKIAAERVFLPKAGWVDWVRHRPLEGKPKTATVSREADCWYVSIQCKVEVVGSLPNLGPAVGIDLGIARPMTLSTGEPVMLPRTSDKERRKLATLQQRLARRTKGSRNRRKAQVAIARFQAKLARRRKDAAHKATTKIAKNHGLIVVEDLKVRNMTASAAGTVEEPGRNVRQKAGLNRSMLDVAPSQIRQMLEYKAAWYGSRLIAVPAAYTSQGCSICGHVHKDNRLTQAEFLCLKCGHAENADVNAAKNILSLGLKTGGLPGLACESNRTTGRKQEKRVARH